MHDAEDLGQAGGVHPGPVEGRAALRAGLGDDLADLAPGVVRMVGVPVEAGDPVGGGHDVDPGLEDLNVQILVGEHAVEREHVGPCRDDLLDRPGRDHPDRPDADDLTGVPADLVRCIAVQANQFQVGMMANAIDHLGAQIAGGDLEDPDSLGCGHR